MTIRPESLGLWSARHQVRLIASELGLDNDDTTDLIIAVGEALSNAYSHGSPYPDVNLIYVTWHLNDDVLTFTVRDEGPGFAPIRLCTETTRYSASRGHGINLMRESVDEVAFDFDSGSRVVLKKRLPDTDGFEPNQMLNSCTSSALVGSP